MSAPRTVTIRTSDHGPVTVPEPEWCVGRHLPDEMRVDITHTSKMHGLNIDNSPHGPINLANACLGSEPFTADPRVYVGIEMGSDWLSCDPDEADAVAAGLVEFAATIRRLARQCAALRATDRQDGGQ